LIKDNFTLRLYARVARLDSFSAAARERGLSQFQASRQVASMRQNTAFARAASFVGS